MKHQSCGEAVRNTGAQRGTKTIAAFALGILFCANVRAVQTISLGWNASTDPSIAGYNLYYGNASGNYNNRVTVGATNSATVTNLTEGQTNYFVVTAYNSAGVEGPPSSQVSFIVPGMLSGGLVTNGGRAMLLQFATAPGHYYVVEASTNLTSWTTLWQCPTATSNVWLTYSDPLTNKLRQRFYRLALH